jgi:hypothetical protein
MDAVSHKSHPSRSHMKNTQISQNRTVSRKYVSLKIASIIFTILLVTAMAAGSVFAENSGNLAPMKTEGPKAVAGPEKTDRETWDRIISNRPEVRQNQSSVPPERRDDGEAAPQPQRAAPPEEPEHWDRLDHVSPLPRTPTVKITPAEDGKTTAYIMAGDVSSVLASIVDLYESVTGSSGDGQPTAAQEWIQGIVTQARDLLTEAGYTHIRFNLGAQSADLQAALEDPATGAIVWIGHGSAGKFYDATGNNETGIINSNAVKMWALSFLDHKGIYRQPVNYPEGSRMRAAMVRISDRAHFDLLYFYAHACSVMQEPQVAIDLMRGGGQYEGYVESKFAYVTALTPPFSNVAHSDIPSVHNILVVPDVSRLIAEVASERIRGAGLIPVVKKGEKAADALEAGLIYKQKPLEGTILNKRIHGKEVILYEYDKPDATATSTGSRGNTTDDATISESKYMIWINHFSKTGRIIVGTVAGFETPKKHCDEWLAGNSQNSLKKEEVTKPIFDTVTAAQEAACGMISDKKIITILGQGKVPSGKYKGKRYWIDGLGCKIQ